MDGIRSFRELPAHTGIHPILRAGVAAENGGLNTFRASYEAASTEEL
jgi:hypothetical protein